MIWESLSLPEHLSSKDTSAAISLVPSIATKVSNILRLTKDTAWLSGWGVMTWVPFFLLSDESARNILQLAPISAWIPIFMVALLGLLASGRWIKNLDASLADIFGHEPILTKAIRHIGDGDLKKFSVNGVDRVTLLLPTNIMDLEWRFLPKKFDWYESWSWILTDLDWFIRSTWMYLGFFPKEILEGYLDKVIVYNSSSVVEWEDKDTQSIINSLPKSLQELIESHWKLKDKSKSRYGWMAYGDKKIFLISTQNTPEQLPETVFHEMTHLILMHFANMHFVARWENTFWVRQEDQTEYAPHKFLVDWINYGVVDAAEDMSTIGQYMFSEAWWKVLDSGINLNQNQWKRQGIFSAKVETMLKLFESQSKGFLDKEYFRRIRNWEIQSWEWAQDYFQNKRKKSYQ